MSTTEEAIEALAQYLTGPEVGHHSVGLAMPAGGSFAFKERADRFFALRKVFGVDNYLSKTEAAEEIVAVLLNRTSAVGA